MECRQGTATQRFPLRTIERRSLLAILIWLLSMGGLTARADSKVIVPPDAAARRYEEGRDAVRRREYAKAIHDLKECLAMGYASPEEHLGRSRTFVQRYDPNYWLGRAFMEMGDEANARIHLLRSKESRLIEGWPEYSDLVARLTLLDQREAHRTLAAREQRTPAPPPAPVATVEAVIRPAPAEPQITTPRTPAVEPIAQAPAPPVVPIERSPNVSETILLRKVITAIAAGSWGGAESALKQLRALNSNLREADLLDAVVGGTRFLLDGRRNAPLLERAKRSLTSFRKRGGTRRTEAFWISPALEALFES